MKKMVVMRGCPGSGKSTFAKEILALHKSVGEQGAIFSTDNYFTAGPYYFFSREALGQAHQWNKWMVLQAAKNDVPLIIVDNTNIIHAEILPYFTIANQHQYEFEIQEPNLWWSTNPLECFRRCTHKVPLETIQRMLDKMISTSDILKSLDWCKQYGLYNNIT